MSQKNPKFNKTRQFPESTKEQLFGIKVEISELNFNPKGIRRCFSKNNRLVRSNLEIASHYSYTVKSVNGGLYHGYVTRGEMIQYIESHLS